MKLEFPLRDPRAPGEACASEVEFIRRVATYSARLLYEVYELAQGNTGAHAERYRLDGESLERLRFAQMSILLALEQARVVPRSLHPDADSDFQRFISNAVGKSRPIGQRPAARRKKGRPR
jgi:hypothetical protein